MSGQWRERSERRAWHHGWDGGWRGGWNSDSWHHSWQPPGRHAWHRDWAKEPWGRASEPRERGGWATHGDWSWGRGDGSGWAEESEEDAWELERLGWTTEAEGPHRYTLLWFHSCHGRPGSVEYSVDSLRERGACPAQMRVVAPAAPRRFSPYQGRQTHQWFEYQTDVMSGGADQDDAQPEQLRAQRRRLLRLLEEELGRLPEGGRLLVGGESQGSSLALDLLLHFRGGGGGKLRGAFSLRGMLQRETLQDLAEDAAPPWIADFPVLVTHGDDDEMVPLPAVTRSYRFLEQCGVRLHFHVLPGQNHCGHSEEEEDVMADFVKRILLDEGDWPT